MTHPAPTAVADDALPPARPAAATAAAAGPAPVPVEVGPGRGGLDRVLVRTPTASAEVYLQGAHLTAWAPAGQPTVVWTGDRSAFAPGAPIRGGVPVCFPWFGPDPAGTGPLHGPVRLRPWTFAGWTRAGDDVVLAFALTSADLADRDKADADAGAGADADGGTTAAWALRYTVTVGARLELALEVASTGTGPLRFEEALHTYLAVADVRETTLLGLGDVARLDRVTGVRTRTPGDARLRVVGRTDHLYDRRAPVTVVDWAGGRSVRVGARGSGNAVVWNPWAETAATLPDLGDDEWSRLLCVETCNVADAAVVLPPGATHTMVATLEVGPLP